MSKEVPKPADPFGFTERERLFDRIGHQRFQALLSDEQTTIHEIKLSTNNYGEFLFVTVSRPQGKERKGLTFWGMGFHEYRERWIADQWTWYDTTFHTKTGNEALDKADAIKEIVERWTEIAPNVTENTQTGRGRLFEMLADLTDEDGALSEIEDFGDFDLFDNE